MENGLVEDYVAGINDFGMTTDAVRKYTGFQSLLSVEYTKKSCMQFFTGLQSLDLWMGQEKNDENRIIKYGDGSIMYSNKTIREDSNKHAKVYISGKIYQVEGYEELDKQYQAMFEALIKDFQSMGIKVVIFLPPYHPLVYDYLKHKDRYKSVFAAEKWYRDFASANNITVIGDYDPAKMNLREKDFMDGMHMQRDSVEKYLRQQLYDGRGLSFILGVANSQI